MYIRTQAFPRRLNHRKSAKACVSGHHLFSCYVNNISDFIFAMNNEDDLSQETG
jgi:hypothetical protein